MYTLLFKISSIIFVEILLTVETIVHKSCATCLTTVHFSFFRVVRRIMTFSLALTKLISRFEWRNAFCLSINEMNGYINVVILIELNWPIGRFIWMLLICIYFNCIHRLWIWWSIAKLNLTKSDLDHFENGQRFLFNLKSILTIQSLKCIHHYVHVHPTKRISLDLFH